MSLFDRVQVCCKIKKVTQQTLLETLNLSPNTFTRWKDGTIPSADKLYKVADFLGVSMEYLLAGHEPTVNKADLELAKQIDSLPSHYKNIVLNMVKEFSEISKNDLQG